MHVSSVWKSGWVKRSTHCAVVTWEATPPPKKKLRLLLSSLSETSFCRRDSKPLATLIRYHYITAKRHDIGRIPKMLRLPFGFVHVCAPMQKEAHMTPALVSCPTRLRRCKTKRLLYTSSQNKLEPNVMQSPTGVAQWLHREGGGDQFDPLHICPKLR